MPDAVRWGVIGSGGIARRRTIPEGIVAAPNARLAAAFDIDATTNSAVAAQFGASAADSVEDLLRRDIDAVYIASPANVHYGHALACAGAGKHILCEKPLGMTIAESEEMAAAASDAGVRFGAALMMRFHSQHRAAKQLIEQGRLGKIVYGRTQLSCWYPPIAGAWRQDPVQGGGGSLIDMGGHCIDLLEMFLGRVARVSCFTRNSVHAYKSEDSAVALLEFASGALGTVDTFFCITDEGSKNALELHGSTGSILAEGTLGQAANGRMTAILKESMSGYDAGQARHATGGIDIAPEPVNMYKAEIESFSNSILNGTEPEVNAEAGIRSQQVLTACYESARTGRVIAV
ncbi:MAG TPA: Gfo/Idh/MocA family oxidoreductase [Bryobacteraceae bacterium]|nr:Gfo/Idh/MocA family oxidoreductase [Bryobacteraceae bacterium]HPT25575.1 Gfo/Idh/MocA family oxidoreductase [Bryobacteraceae bacterium]